MRNVKRVIAMMAVFTLLATSTALALPATSTLNGTWDAKMDLKIAGITISTARIVFQNGKARLSLLGKNSFGTYKMLTKNRFQLTMPPNSLGTPSTQTYSYTIKSGKMTLKGKFLGTSAKLVFEKQTPKISKVSANKVKRGKTSTIKVTTNRGTDFVTLTNAAGKAIKVSKITRSGNVFTIKAKFTGKKNTVYVRAGIYDFDGNISSKSKLSGKKKLVVQCT